MAAARAAVELADDWSDNDFCRARLVLSWWAEQMRLWVDGVLVHEGDCSIPPAVGRCLSVVVRGLRCILCWSSAAPCMTMGL